MSVHLLFLAFVVVAVYIQNVTGFALALVLLGLVGVTNLLPLPDVANAVSVMAAVNAAVFLRRRRPLRAEPAVRRAIPALLIGSIAGMWLVTQLAVHAYQVLRVLLGLSVISCALLLWSNAQPLSKPSGSRAFVFVGSLAGVLGGMFSASGPPLVYLAYRQPWPLARIQESLVFCFGVGATFRLVAMAATGHFSVQAALLALEALPVVFAVTSLTANRPPSISGVAMKHLVCTLLMLAGLGMLVPSGATP